MSFSGKYEVYGGMGELTVTEDGLYVIFTYAYTGKAELSRLVISSGDRALSLGIPSPSGGGLSLKKRLSQSELRRAGICHIDSARLVPPGEQVSPAAALEEFPTQADAPAQPSAPSPPKAILRYHIGGRVVSQRIKR